MSSSVCVCYTYEPNTATVTVLLEKNGTDPIQVIPALPALPLGASTVTWNLQTGTGVSNPAFNLTTGITFGTVPPGLTVTNSRRVSDTAWEVSLNNAVGAPTQTIYNISGNSDQGPFQADPAIAVLPDPPPGG